MLVYFAVLLTVLLGFCGLAIDVGRVELRELQLQGAADDAALSAATQLQQGDSDWKNAAAAEASAYLSANGIPAATTDTPLLGPASGPYLGDTSTVQVTLHQTVKTVFLGLISKGTSSITLSTTALARVPPCTYFIAGNTSGSGHGVAYLASAEMSSTCPIWAQNALGVDYFASIRSGPAGTSGTAGTSYIGGSVFPNVSYLTPQMTDPLAYVRAPVFNHCDHTNASYSSAATLQPGTYCGGLNANAATLTLQPGLYVITGGANWSNSTINGTSVTLYFTQGGGSGFGTFSLNNHSTMKVSAPADGTKGGIPGVLLFGDRAWSGGYEDFKFDTSSFSGDGILYTSNTGIYDSSCNLSGPNYFSMITDNLYLFGASVAFSNNYDALPGGSPLHNYVSLVQ